MQYAELVKTVKSYVENDFPATLGTSGLSSAEQINTFIQQAEQRIYNAAQILALRKNVTGTTTISNAYLSLPSDWLAPYSLAVVDPTTGAYTYLDNKDVNYIREAYPIPTSTEKPMHYANFDADTILLGPTPDAAYSVQMHYFYYPESIVTANTTWLGDNFDTVLLYGTLLEAYVFMKGEEDVITAYKTQYDAAIFQLKQLAEGKDRMDTYRVEQPRVPVS